MRTTLFILFFLIFSSCDLKTAEQYTSEATILNKNKDYKGAINLLDEAIKKDNKYIDAYIERGVNKAQLNDNIGAINDFKKVLLIDSDNTLALFNIGKIYCNLKKYKLSIDFYNKAFKTKGGDVIYLDSANNKLVDLGQKYDVKGQDIFYERAIAFYNSNDLKNSFKDFKTCIEQNCYVKESYYWIGYIYLNANEHEKACGCFRKAKENGDSEVELNEIQKYCK